MRLRSSQAQAEPGQQHWASWAQEEACGDHWGHRKQKSRTGQGARNLEGESGPQHRRSPGIRGLEWQKPICQSYHAWW